MKRYNLKNIKQSGFKTPKGYFENLEDKLLNLSNTPLEFKDTGFKVPDYYFETVENSILTNVSNQKETKVIQLFNKKTIIAGLSIAASIALLFNLSIFEKQITYDSLDTETLEAFVLNQDLESSDIANLFANEDFNKTLITEFVSDNTLENYLLNTENVEDLLSE